MQQTTTPSSKTAQRGFATWTTRDLLITLAISITIGIVYIPLNNIYTAVNAVNPIAGWAMSGLFALPAFFIGYIIRRPGAVMLYALILGWHGRRCRPSVYLGWSPASSAGLWQSLRSGSPRATKTMPIGQWSFGR